MSDSEDLWENITRVKQGKPCLSMTIKKDTFEMDGFQPVLAYNRINYHMESLDEYWDVLYIYEDPQMKEIIEATPHIPKTKYDHWVLGCLFGYSHEAIMKFIEEEN